jgi:hypothetical protein
VAGTYNFVCEQGATFDRTVTWTDAAGVPVDLTGWTGRMQARGPGGVVLDFTTSEGTMTLGGTAGTVRLLHAPAETGTVAPGTYDYDLLLTRTSDGYAKRLLEGKLVVKKRVTA